MTTDGSHNPARRPTQAELDDMTPEQLATLAAELDDVVLVRNANRWPISGTRAEKRAERSVAAWFGLSALFAALFFAAYIWWTYQYKAPGQPGHLLYTFYTPVIGASFGLAVLFLGVGTIAYVKRFFPDELAIQQRHD